MLVGLLQAPVTGPLLDDFGVTVDRVRTAKRNSHGYQLASRFSTLTVHKAGKTQQVGRIARLVEQHSRVAHRPVIEPSDILEVMAVDGLGWGMGIMEDLGLNERLICDGLARPGLVGETRFAAAPDFAARRAQSRQPMARRQRARLGLRRPDLKAGIAALTRCLGWLATLRRAPATSPFLQPTWR
jgi:hypothetical protein